MMKILVSTNRFENNNRDEDGFILGDEKPKWNFQGKYQFYFDLNDQDDDIRTYADFDVEAKNKEVAVDGFYDYIMAESDFAGEQLQAKRIPNDW